MPQLCPRNFDLYKELPWEGRTDANSCVANAATTPLAEFPMYQWLIAQGKVELGFGGESNPTCGADASTFHQKGEEMRGKSARRLGEIRIKKNGGFLAGKRRALPCLPLPLPLHAGTKRGERNEEPNASALQQGGSKRGVFPLQRPRMPNSARREVSARPLVLGCCISAPACYIGVVLHATCL